MKTKNFWFVIVLILIIVLGGYFYMLNNKAPALTVVTTPATSTTEVAGTENWTLYSAEGYDLKYPADFTITQNADGSARLAAPVKTYFRTILTNEAYITAYAPTSTCPSSQGESFQATTTVNTPNGVSLSKATWSGVGAGQLYQGADYTVMKDGECYEISLYTHSADGAGFYFNDPATIKSTDATQAEDMANFKALADTIVSTFNFK